jgi:hypothetical protein
MSSLPMTPAESEPQPVPTPSSDLNQLATRVSQLESRFPANSWLWGPSFVKRAFALWGHVIIVQLIIAVVIWAIVFGCAFLFGGLAILGRR